MKKRKMILSVMLLLSITTGCAAGEAKALSDSKGRMSLSQQIAKCNSKESAISIAENGIEKIFGANKYALAGDASYNQDTGLGIMPSGLRRTRTASTLSEAAKRIRWSLFPRRR